MPFSDRHQPRTRRTTQPAHQPSYPPNGGHPASPQCPLTRGQRQVRCQTAYPPTPPQGRRHRTDRRERAGRPSGALWRSSSRIGGQAEWASVACCAVLWEQSCARGIGGYAAGWLGGLLVARVSGPVLTCPLRPVTIVAHAFAALALDARVRSIWCSVVLVIARFSFGDRAILILQSTVFGSTCECF